MDEQSVPPLWRDYLFLSREMDRFLGKHDFSMFQELMDQRQKLQQMIEDSSDKGFCASQPGRTFAHQIQAINAEINYKLQYSLNSRRRRDTTERAYGAGLPRSSGSWINKQG